MKSWGSIIKQTVSATLVASLVSGTYGSLAFADQPTEVRSCRIVLAEQYLKEHEVRLTSEVAPVIRGAATRVRNAAALVLSKIRKPTTWIESTYLAKYAEVRDALDHDKQVVVADYQSPEALLAVWDASSERARADAGIFKGEFSFGAMMRNATPATRNMSLRNVRAALDSKGYKSWQASDAMINMYILSKDPADTLGYVRSRGMNQAIRDVIRTRLEAQIMRRELGSVLSELGLGRADQPMKDVLIKGWLVGRRFFTNILWTAAILHGSLPSVMSLAALHSVGMTGVESISVLPIGDVTRTRAPLSPEMEELLKTKNNMDDLWSQVPLKDKAAASAQVNLKIGQYVAIRIMTMVFFAMILDQFWKWNKPGLRSAHPELADVLSLPRPWTTKGSLETDVYNKWKTTYTAIDPNIDQTPVAADVRRQIHVASKAALADLVYNDATFSDIGVKAQMTPEQMRAAERTVDQNADGTDNSPYAGLPRFSE